MRDPLARLTDLRGSMTSDAAILSALTDVHGRFDNPDDREKVGRAARSVALRLAERCDELERLEVVADAARKLRESE